MTATFHDGAWLGAVYRDAQRIRLTWTLGGGEVAAPTLSYRDARRYALAILAECDAAEPLAFEDNTYGDFANTSVCERCGAIVSDRYLDAHALLHAK